MEEEFGPAEEIRQDIADENTHWYWKKGISLDFNADSKVTLIHLFMPIGAAPEGAEGPLQRQQELRKAAIEALHRKATLTKYSGN